MKDYFLICDEGSECMEGTLSELRDAWLQCPECGFRRGEDWVKLTEEKKITNAQGRTLWLILAEEFDKLKNAGQWPPKF